MNERRVMYVEDEPQLRELIKISLEVEGFEVYDTDNLIDATEFLRKNGKGLYAIVSDGDYPVVLNGEVKMGAYKTLLHNINKLGIIAPVYIVSAKDDYAKEAVEAGAKEFLFKPVTKPSDLINRLNSL